MDLFLHVESRWIRIILVLCLWDASSGQTVYSVTEEVKKGTAIGNIAKDLHINALELEARMFQIVPGPYSQYFKVDLKTGLLVVNGRIDRDELCQSHGKCSLKMEVIAHGPTYMRQVEIEVLDINDNPPTFPVASYSLNITEHAFQGDRFLLQMASDADIGINAVRTYKLSPNEHFSLDVQNSNDHDVSAELVLQKSLDREKQPEIHLVLTALDGGKPPKSGTLDITVHVIDVNDNTPTFSKSLYKTKLPENAPFGTTVITINATDADEGLNGEVIYSLAAHGNVKQKQPFSIDPDSGIITTTGLIDFEETPAYELRVQAMDKGTPPRVGHCKVLIEVVDLNDNAPEMSITSLLTTLPEDAKLQTAVALITVVDRDAGKNGVVHCAIADSSPFKLDSSYNDYLSLVVDGPLDRESTPQYNITITATDEGTPPLSSSGIFTVHISDVNDNAPKFQEPIMNVHLKENSVVGSKIVQVTAHDADVKENADVTYTLVDAKNNVNPLSNYISINSETGEIYSVKSFNFEEFKQFRFLIQATDSGTPALSSSTSVNVFILDENDNSPVILPPYSDQGSVNSENIPYSAEAGYFVAKIRAVDADSGYNALLSYHISEPKGTNLFRIGTSSGEIRTKRRMSDSDFRTHPLVIMVSDHGDPPLSATVSMEVVIVESTSDTQTPFKENLLKEDTFSDLNLYLFMAIASVSAIFLISLTTLIAVKCHRTDGIFSSCSAPMITTHPDGSWSYSKTTQQYDVCFSSDTLKSDVVVFPSPFPPADAELISIDGDTGKRTQTLPSTTKVVLFTITP
ncbi:protocadherin alpha-2-like [Sardina pilchardus]|uniref:protocadherin alpha-2-like n=1 Tax=Sardina pilchardus TaxID=27697 RepID=UPI002E14166D